ncbi:CTP synthase [Sanguibacter sp. 4.1]|uniref:CTP synthase n=1 Tax=Sanguibacter biliveldensis TaxID=3030830 RepID=A0AAF0Z0Q5_9MICO|nr:MULTISPECIES: CTP synthase [unclassified Sanguibacter]KQT98591.1 CTP synthetase [Sanguibacter sp. Leaf3]WPF80920.1 CTP synthase [Sanguibacter sp. 4.1]
MADHVNRLQSSNRVRSESTTRHIFVTGGVASSLGKGLTASSLGRLLRARGLRVTMQKLDPYLNVDPGTMNPFQHGEVFVTEDGAETDLDIGHYERFLDVDLEAAANVTTGQVYSQVIAKERRGEYLGDTVQVIPHITDEIKSRMRAQASNDVDVIITEIGGTVGDIESQPFLEAARQVRHELGRDDVFFLHVSLVPYIGPSGELKTKPTQHSVAALRSIGIQPDAIVLRSDREVPEGTKRKIALFCDVDNEAVINCMDAPSIYDIPRVIHSEGLDAYVVRRLGLPFHDVDWDGWSQLLERVHEPAHRVEIALVGKYIDLPDAYLSVTEALRAGGFANDTKVVIRWVPSDECQTPEGAQTSLEGVDAVLVPGGFGVRGIEGKLGALRWAREGGVPTLGICLGLQSMVMEYARNVVGLEGASSSEFDPQTPHPVIATMAEQQSFVDGAGDLGGTMRLGAYDAALAPGSVAAGVYGTELVSERHRHRYEVNNAYRAQLEEAGLVFSGTSPDGTLVEFVELAKDVHPFYISTQAHPEFKSRPTRAHPLFAGLVRAALDRQGV